MKARVSLSYGLVGAILFVIVLGGAHGLDVDIDAALEQINRANRVADSYAVTVDMALFEPGKDPQVSSMRNYIRGLDTVLAVYTEPAKDRGKKILLSGGNMWMYFPKAGRSIIIRPTWNLFGTVNTGDILSPPVLDLYELDSWEIAGEGEEERLVLIFKAKTMRAPYGRLVYHYDWSRSEGRILYSECYARSGILLKRAFFSDYVFLQDGFGYASRVRYESAVEPGVYVLIRLSNFERKEIKDYYFTPDGLKYVTE